MWEQRAQRWMAMVIALGMFGGSACAGGGSSGFDISARSEDAAITQALAQHRCLEQNRLTLCPADTTAPAGPGNVFTGLAGTDHVECSRLTTDAACTFTLPVVAQGFPTGTAYRVAVRRVGPKGPWLLTAAPLAQGTLAPDFEVDIAAPVAAGDPSDPLRIQVAVLVFLDPPPALPDEFADLADSGADFAFLTPEIELQPQ